MDINEIAKFVFIIGLTGSIVGISIQLMRLLSATTESIKDLRKTIKNIGVLSDELLEDHRIIQKGLKSFSFAGKTIKNLSKEVSEQIGEPIRVIGVFLSGVAGMIQIISQKLGLTQDSD